ncbi:MULTISPECIES: ComF family protein [Clostridium]|uniref:ComF family protein n=1 Tax=Clostridium TaxID=1485 RepID=UPI00082478DD|nr:MULTISPECIES: ComF family protein [Clostridium]PJI09177.1 ComF family protein [Clostridium sp. CT7]
MGERIINYLKYIFNAVISVIYFNDGKCAVCKTETYDDKNLCIDCFNKIKFCYDSSFIEKSKISFEVYCLAYYSSVIREMIIRLKYRKDFMCGEVLAGLMYDVIQRNAIQFDEISFVPMIKEDLARRGFNQSKFLAMKICEKCNKPLSDYIKKCVKTKDQIGLTDEMRWNNLQKTFAFAGKNKIENKIILLIDDVFTTGATSFFCSRELINNGAKKVIVLTAAKSSI